MTHMKTLTVCLALVAAAALTIVLIFNTEPEAKREAATKQGPMLVQVQPVSKGAFTPQLSAMGVVTSAQQVQLTPQVAGQVVAVMPEFTPGTTVREGQPLLYIDDADYQLQREQRLSAMQQAQAALNIEMGEQAVAEKEYQRLGQNLSAMQQALVLREPQKASAQAAVSAAKAALAQAELNIARTTIAAPFNAEVLSRTVSTGSSVSQSTNLGQLVATDMFWIEATLPAAHLAFLPTPKAGGPLDVQVTASNLWPDGAHRLARLRSVVGELSRDTRLVKVLLEVPDPLALKNNTHPALLIGAYVQCLIPARTLDNVVRVERSYIRKNDTAWVMAGDALSIRPLTIVFQDERYAYISEGLAQGDLLVVSDLARVRDGAPLRVQEPADEQ